MLTTRSFAKINWMLRIIGKRDDGFHELETIFQSISLHDVLTFAISDEVRVTCDDSTIPTDERNLAGRAAAAMIEEFGIDPVHIDIRKVIPSGGGLGGGSSNAAMTLLALDKLFELRAPISRLMEIAATIGSDVPFFLLGGTVHGTGRGEVLEMLPAPAPVHLLLVLPGFKVETASAYGMLADRRSSGALQPTAPLGIARTREMMRRGIVASAWDLVNDLEPPVFDAWPALARYKEALLSTGADLVLMSGSGSTIFAAYQRADTRDAALRMVANGGRTVACEPITAHQAMRDLR